MEILLLACLIASPGTCRTERIGFDDAAPPPACTLRGQSVVATWSESHPKWRVERWRCAPAGMGGTDV